MIIKITRLIHEKAGVILWSLKSFSVSQRFGFFLWCTVVVKSIDAPKG